MRLDKEIITGYLLVYLMIRISDSIVFSIFQVDKGHLTNNNDGKSVNNLALRHV